MKKKRFGILVVFALVLSIFAMSAVGCDAKKGKWEKDTSTWGIYGTGAGNVLYASNWSTQLTPATTLKNESTETVNKFTISIDLWEGDMLKFLAGLKELGYQDLSTKDTKIFVSDDAGGMIADSAHKNIKVVTEGNYTFTLTTNPAVVSDNKIDYVKNGAVVGQKVSAAKSVFIKGDGVSEWQNYYSPYHKFNTVDLNVKYEKTMWLAAKSIMLVSQNVTVATDAVSINNAEAQYGKLAEASKTLVSNAADARMAGRNIDIKTAGVYKLTYEPEVKHTVNVVATAGAEATPADVTGKLSLEKISEQAVMTAEDYYIDGEYGGKAWITAGKTLDSAQKLAQVGETTKYSIELTLAVNDQFNINSYVAGQTATGAQLVNRKVIYNHDYVMDSKYFEDSTKSKGGNIKVKTAGTYVVTIDAYSKIVKILPKAAVGEENYTVIICGPSATGDWNLVLFDAAHTLIKIAGQGQTYKLKVTLAVGELNARGYDDGITFGNAPINIGKGNYDATGTANANFDILGNNIKCNTAGIYEVVVKQVEEATKLVWKIQFNTAT